MDSSSWENVKELFHRSLELSPIERASFLVAACNGDAELRRDVEGLLSAHDQAGDFIVDPVVVEAGLVSSTESEPDTASDSSYVPALVGQYEIIRELGRGGMGAVFLAHRADAQFEKQVAIKIVKRGMDTETILRRFVMERQILANLEHPNIARFLDGGTTDDALPYFVMEYVEGEPINRYCESRRLSTTERLHLFLQVCSAVQHAHQNLIVHRDIKPSNIMVAADGTPKLLDFGIAKLVTTEVAPGEADQTATALRLMTPEYASPEQLRGLPITTASDVYSLGVIFYELLSGHRPFRFNSRMPEEIARVLLTEEPLKPSSVVTLSDLRETIPVENIETPGSLNSERDTSGRQKAPAAIPACSPKSLRGDLDNIALKALRKDPERRYASVQEFAADIRRHLQGLPVSARPDTLGYRAGKFVRRHKASAIAAIIAIVALISGTSVALWQAHVARSERDRAETRFNQVRKLANSIVFDYHDQIQKLPGSTPVREKMIGDAIEYLDNLSGEGHNDPTLQRELAAAYEKIGDVQGNPYFQNLGDEKGARESYRKAVEIREELYRQDPSSLAKYELGNGYKNLGDILWSAGANEQALSHYEKAMTFFNELSGEDPANLKYRSRVNAVLNGIGHVQEQMDDLPGALESYTRMLTADRELLAAEPNNDEYRRGVAVSYLKVGDAQSSIGDHVACLDSYQKGAEILSERVKADDTNAPALRELALAYGRTANAYGRLKQPEQAVTYTQKTIDLQTRIANADPQNKQIEFDLATSYQNLAETFRGLKKLDAATINISQAIHIFLDALKNEAGPTQARGTLAIAYQIFGEIEAAKKNPPAAMENYRKALAIMEVEPIRSSYSVDLASCYEDVGDLESTRHDPKAAMEAYQRSLSILLDVDRAGKLTAGQKSLLKEISEKIAKGTSSRSK